MKDSLAENTSSDWTSGAVTSAEVEEPVSLRQVAPESKFITLKPRQTVAQMRAQEDRELDNLIHTSTGAARHQSAQYAQA